MSFGETEIVVSEYAIKSKLFRHMPDNSWRVPESFWKLFGIFRNKKPEMFRSCWNRFRCFSQMKITKLELFQNALKIIMVGTGNVLSPHKYLQFERTLKNVVMNSESAFLLGFLEKPP